MAKSYINYLRKAKTRHGVHSPFVYSLVEDVIQQKDFHGQKEIKDLRKELLSDHTELVVNDLGAGSRILHNKNRKVKDIAKISGASIRQCGILSRLAMKLESKNILELGTNLGISAATFGYVPTTERIVTIEGDESLASIAKKHLLEFGTKVKVVNGDFESKLRPSLEALKQVDLAYIDGNHSEEPTLAYFESILPYCSNTSVIVIGDIHWSKGMESAWQKIKNHPKTKVSIDLFDMGFIFFNSAFSKEDFILRNV
jgi:predicted O-methyltransferase YrrM